MMRIALYTQYILIRSGEPNTEPNIEERTLILDYYSALLNDGLRRDFLLSRFFFLAKPTQIHIHTMV